MEDLREFRRIVFFSEQDMSSEYNLRNAERVLKNIKLSQLSDINDYLEIYNIKLYFDNDMFLSSWNEETRSHFRATIKETWEEIVWEFNSINDRNLLLKVSSLDYIYQKSFWELFNNLGLYKNIHKLIFSDVLKENPHQIRIILAYQKIVNQFSHEITIFLKGFSKSAELLLSNYEQDNTSNVPTLYFPKSLSIQDKHEIISEYIKRDSANLNFIRLAERSTSQELKLSNKLKLKAKNRSQEINDQILKEGSPLSFGVQVVISEEQEEPARYDHRANTLNATYGRKTLDSLISDVDLFRVFDMLFHFTDTSGLITLVNKSSEMSVMERLFVKSKNEYSTGIAFEQKDQLSQLQIKMFHHYLTRRNKSIEKVIQSFITEVLNGLFNLEVLQFNFPSMNSSFLEKIRVLAPEFEFLIKQYQAYVDEGEIDFDLLKISSVMVPQKTGQ